MTGPYSVVLLCDCRTRCATGYIARHLTRPDAEAKAAEFTHRNNHAVMIVLSNGLDEPSQFYRPPTTTTSTANR